MVCANCGAGFEARRSTARFCSDGCRVRSKRKRLREEVIARQGGRCVFAIPDDEPDDHVDEDLEPVEFESEDLGECHGALVVVKVYRDGRRTSNNCEAVCTRHKGMLGEERFKSKFEPELYREIREKQGREKAGNAHFRNNVGGFMKGYRRPEKLGAKSSWRKPYDEDRDEFEKLTQDVWLYE